MWSTPGGYFADVVGYGAGAGSYTLQLACDENAPYHVFGGGCVGSNGLVPTWNVRDRELSLPANASLSGTMFAQQAFGFDPPANALCLTTSSAGTGILSILR